MGIRSVRHNSIWTHPTSKGWPCDGLEKAAVASLTGWPTFHALHNSSSQTPAFSVNRTQILHVQILSLAKGCLLSAPSPAPEAPLPPSPESQETIALPPQESAPPAAPKRRQYILPYLMLLIFLLTLLPAPLFVLGLVLPGPAKETKIVIIPRGSSVQDIARLLDENGLIIHPLFFRATSRLMAKDQLKAGEYEIPAGLSAMDITGILQEGKTVLRQVTVPEGLTSYEITTILINTPALTGEITSIPEDGTLLPETYNYTFGDTRQSILDRMQKDSHALVEDMWSKREDNLPLHSARDAVILASIVEKETGKLAEERPLVASVFINRLRLRMPLQSDPTVIYALTDGTGSLGRKLTRADLMTPSPMNTYVNAGLPPKAISNPGRAALMAVLHPQKSDYLYFVANGTGGHSFAQTLAEHNKNVAKWFSMSRP